MSLVDSGAYANLLNPDLCPILGIKLEDGKESVAVGIGGVIQKTYFHKLKMDIAGYKFDFYGGFTVGMSVEPCLLGQNGFFNLFKKVSFDYNAGEIELIW